MIKALWEFIKGLFGLQTTPTEESEPTEAGVDSRDILPEETPVTKDEITDEEGQVEVGEEPADALPQEFEEVKQQPVRKYEIPIETDRDGFTEIAREPAYLNVGIDYGTSTTKVAVRDVAEDVCYIIPLRDTKDPMTRYTLPSTLVFRDGKIFFGLSGAECGPEDELVRSLKVCLACRPDLKNCAEGEKLDDRIDCDRKTITIAENILSIELCVAFYLGFVFNIIWKVLERFYPDSVYERKLSYVISAPVESMEDQGTLDSFHRVVDVGLKINDPVNQGLDFRTITDTTVEIGFERAYDLNDTGRPFQIRPEAVAAIMPLLENMAIHLDEGLYAVVDVGAGTTDSSYFRLAKFPGRTTISLYNVHSRAVGGDNLDRAILNIIPGIGEMAVNDKVRLLQSIRTWKRSMNLDGEVVISLDGNEIPLEHSAVTGELWEHADEVREVMTKAFQKSYSKERRIDVWRDQKVFLVGGGGQLEQVRAKILNGPRNIDCNVELLDLLHGGCHRHESDNGGPPDGENGNKCGSDRPDYLFQVVKGLSYHPMNAPNIYLPSSVDDFSPSVELKTKRDFNPDWWREQD